MPNVKTKKGYPHGQPIFIVNLKSNTMKNTVQIYELYVMWHTFLLGKFIYLTMFNKIMLQNIILDTHLASSRTSSSGFVYKNSIFA